MSSSRHARAHFDGAWKTALQTWLRECLELFWPDIHDALDWRHAPVYLDKEVKALGRIRDKSARQVDLLAELRLKSGARTLLLIHLEVQAGNVAASFSERDVLPRVPAPSCWIAKTARKPSSFAVA